MASDDVFVTLRYPAVTLPLDEEGYTLSFRATQVSALSGSVVQTRCCRSFFSFLFGAVPKTVLQPRYKIKSFARRADPGLQVEAYTKFFKQYGLLIIDDVRTGPAVEILMSVQVLDKEDIDATIDEVWREIENFDWTPYDPSVAGNKARIFIVILDLLFSG